MTIYAVANRKGGVGKSTVATMLAYGFSAVRGQNVLLIDLDAQCNASLILFGGQNWSNARIKGRNIADYFGDCFDHSVQDIGYYIFPDVGDIGNPGKNVPNLSLTPGSLILEDIEHELLHARAPGRALGEAEENVIGRMQVLLEKLCKGYSCVVLDCPPGLSFATKSAIRLAHMVIVPFRPDFVSNFAVDRISFLIEGKANLDTLDEIPHKERRYRALGNFMTDEAVAQERLQDIEAYHPVLTTQIPLDDQIASSFNWRAQRVSIDAKFGRKGAKIVKALVDEVAALA
ncbi:MAG: ParA family protein [Hyphomicrobiales bacterium]|nr:ParA family protein [Hyphomicrobiales bacterium]